MGQWARPHLDWDCLDMLFLGLYVNFYLTSGLKQSLGLFVSLPTVDTK